MCSACFTGTGGTSCRDRGFLCPFYNAVNGTGELELELKVRQININRGCSEGILGKCESLKGYMALEKKL